MNCADCYHMRVKLPVKNGRFIFYDAIAKCSKMYHLKGSGMEKRFQLGSNPNVNTNTGKSYANWELARSCVDFQSMND